MTTLTLAKLAQIEAAATKATPGPWEVVDGYYPAFKELRGPSFKVSVVMFATGLTEKDYQARNADLKFLALCDPATVAALCRDARRYMWLRAHATPPTLASIAWGHSTTACEFSEPDDAIDAALREERG